MFVLVDMSSILVMDSFLFLVSLIDSGSTSISVGSSLTSCCLETSFLSVSLSSKSFSNSFLVDKDSFKILDSSLLKSSSLFSVILS